MKREDLFQAIGAVEESRLVRSEWSVSSREKTEDRNMRVRTKRIVRNLLVAVLIIAMLAVTAYAVTGFLLFGSPEEMIRTVFGDQTGFDHKPVTQWTDPQKPGSSYSNPAYDRVPVDETVMQEDILPYVSPVGRSAVSGDYRLTVDAFAYDASTGCGFVTYLLENEKGVGGYQLQTNGEIWYEGVPDPVQVNQYGYPHIIREKTTDTCLAVTYYFRDTGMHGDTLILELPCQEPPRTLEEINEIIMDLDQQVRQRFTAEEALEKVKELIGEAIFEEASRLPDGLDMTQQQWEEECAYSILRDKWYSAEYEQKGPSVIIDMDGEPLNHITAENGAIVISPISFQLDVTGLGEPWSEEGPEVYELLIRYRDGSEYEVLGMQVDNTVFRLIDSATEGKADTHNRYTCMFNRIIDVDSIASVKVNGDTIKLDG